MNKKQLDKLKKMLIAEKQSVLKHLVELRGVSEQSLEEGSGDAVDIASVEISQAAIQKLGTRELKHLKKIDHALKKFDNDEFGICESCGEEIAYARLEARPVAQFCIDCKTLQEQRERQYIDEDDRSEDEQGWSGGEGEDFSSSE